MHDNETSPSLPPGDVEHTRTGLSVDAIRRAFLDNLFYVLGRSLENATANEKYQALAYTVRDRMLQRWAQSSRTHKQGQYRTVSYLSAEYLPGPHLGNAIINLGIFDNTRQAMQELGLELDFLLDQEEDPGLGNGGLGRLAACFMDSLATLQLPAIGYGIRYEFGIFDQHIREGWQLEVTDSWLRHGNPWELRRSAVQYEVKIGGHTETYVDELGRTRTRWLPEETLLGIAYDTPVLGFGVNNTNLMRLWSAEASVAFDIAAFNKGDYYGAVNHKIRSETISKVLYPNDEPETGKRLRLVQQYFFVSCSLQDMIRLHTRPGLKLERFHEKFVVQLNDTHPAIAVVELQRLLVDEHGLEWDVAWETVRRTFAYTNHTLLPEALERWQVALFEMVLPRHLEMIFEINMRFLDQMRMRYLHDAERIARLSIIDETGSRHVRMANLACVGSFAINGVAELHSCLLQHTVLKDFYDLWPTKFHNKTNGVTPRRFMMLSNMGLARLLCDTLGHGWANDLNRLRDLEPHAEDPAFRERWREVKTERKAALADYMQRHTGVVVDPESLFDVQAKRIHEYKRQHLNVLHIVTRYLRIKQNPAAELVPRTYIFGGKAAPGYTMAKLMIKLIHAVGEVVNNDPDVAGRIKVVFVPDFNVKVAQWIYPAANLSEQISTAGMEASGTGNMKFAMNGALTIGTLDGANLEIRDEVGEENFFLFGLTAPEAESLRRSGYRPMECYQNHAELKEVIDLLASGLFSHGNTQLFRPLINHLLDHDDYLLLADYPDYIACQERVDRLWNEPDQWTRMSILNTARMGKFSSDRTILEYNRDVWKVNPVPIQV